jgi:hypothetical protein
MANALATYVSDHLAGAMFAVELLKHLRDTHADAPLGEFAEQTLVEVEKDRAVLQRLYDQINDRGNVLKEVSSWFAEKTARLKLQLGRDTRIGELEALETLCLGVWGKLKLWTALSQLGDADPRFRELDLDELVTRARVQHDDIEAYRLKLAKAALSDRSASVTSSLSN